MYIKITFFTPEHGMPSCIANGISADLLFKGNALIQMGKGVLSVSWDNIKSVIAQS